MIIASDRASRQAWDAALERYRAAVAKRLAAADALETAEHLAVSRRGPIPAELAAPLAVGGKLFEGYQSRAWIMRQTSSDPERRGRLLAMHEVLQAADRQLFAEHGVPALRTAEELASAAQEEALALLLATAAPDQAAYAEKVRIMLDEGVLGGISGSGSPLGPHVRAVLDEEARRFAQF